jgi:cellulose biosynthesis protein BcsQ
VKVVAVYNAKGGVGKTATAVNLGYVASRRRLRTLVWDLDAQGAATFTFRVRHRLKGGVKVLTTRRDRVTDRIRGTDFEHLDLLPSDLELRNVDLAFDASKNRTNRLAKVVEELAAEDYDLVLVDCPPSASLISENIFVAADALLVPVIPTTLSVRTLGQLMEFLARSGGRTPPLHVMFSMVDGRKNLHAQIPRQLRAEGAQVLATSIPAATEVEQMGVHRAPVGAFAPHSAVAQAYERLWDEVSARL